MNHIGIITLACVLIAVFASNASAQSHNITWGHREPRDMLLKKEIFQKKSKVLQIVSADFAFSNYTRKISQIVVTDQYVNGKGGYATLLAGGPGSDAVTIHCKSQRGHGFNFIIEIYGY